MSDSDSWLLNWLRSNNFNFSGDYSSMYEDFMEYTYGGNEPPTPLLTRIGKSIVIYVLPFLIAGGIVGNVFSLVTFCSSDFRNARCAVLLSALAVVDILVLTIDGGFEWTFIVFQDFHTNLSFVPHYMLYYLRAAVKLLSAWTIVLITFERLVSVTWPLRAGNICSRKKMAVSWFVMLLINALAVVCIRMHSVVRAIGMQGYFWFRLLSQCLLPFLFIVAGNAGIIHKMRVAQRNRMTTMAASSPAAEAAASDARAVTKMLVIVCVVFVMTTSPFHVAIVVYTYNQSLFNDSPVFYLIYHCLLVLFCFNSATNFLLYFFSGTQFRKAFMKLLCKCKCCKTPCYKSDNGIV